MSKYIDRAMAIRQAQGADGKPAFNCCQTVVAVFAEDLGYDEQTLLKAATYFRSGMQIGSVCGAITGGLMVLGLAGLSDAPTANGFFKRFREAHEGMLNCKDLLRVNAERGGAKGPHCNAMICESIGYLESILREQGKID